MFPRGTFFLYATGYNGRMDPTSNQRNITEMVRNRTSESKEKSAPRLDFAIDALPSVNSQSSPADICATCCSDLD